MEQHSDASRTHRHADARLALIATGQHSAFSRQQALDAGFTRGMISRRLMSGRWVPADYAVYRIAGAAPNWQQRLMAACLGGPAVASHRAAGALWALPGMPAGIVEVTALRHRRRRTTDVVWHESYHLTDRDVTAISGIPVTRPIRTFLDLGLVLRSAELEEVLDNGLHRNLLDIPAIWRCLDELGDLRPGAPAVRALLESRVHSSRPAESVLETRFRQLLQSSGLPMPTPQLEICAGAELIGRLDFAYPDVKLAIELDGAAYHSSERARQRDRSRDNRLASLGWRVLRFSWADVNDQPSPVVDTLRCVHGAT